MEAVSSIAPSVAVVVVSVSMTVVAVLFANCCKKKKNGEGKSPVTSVVVDSGANAASSVVVAASMSSPQPATADEGLYEEPPDADVVAATPGEPTVEVTSETTHAPVTKGQQQGAESKRASRVSRDSASLAYVDFGATSELPPEYRGVSFSIQNKKEKEPADENIEEEEIEPEAQRQPVAPQASSAKLHKALLAVDGDRARAASELSLPGISVRQPTILRANKAAKQAAAAAASAKAEEQKASVVAMTRDEAEAILRMHGLKEGTFLFRESNSVTVLSMCSSGRVVHFNVERPNNKGKMPRNRFTEKRMQKFIAHYSKQTDGFLPTLLTTRIMPNDEMRGDVELTANYL
eukprot:m.35565 g.35565  ORF g.35565 m.35565 type:complete len:349 (-) comp10933_c0_seq1:293-1339(-)